MSNLYIPKSGICDAQPEDRVIEFCLLLMAVSKEDKKDKFATGTATVLGSGVWNGPDGEETVIVAATARHCLANLFKRFGVREPRPLIAGLGSPQPSNIPWVLCGGRETGQGHALWHCIWQCMWIDDLALLYLRPVNELAKGTAFEQPVISYFSPEIGTELWGFGFGNCKDVDESTHDFESGAKLCKGQIIEYLDGSRQERWVTDLPFVDGMSGGPVFWKNRLVGLISSKMESENSYSSFVMRIQMLYHIPIDNAPALNGKSHEKLQSLVEAGIIATMPTVERVNSVKAVPRFGLEVWTRMN